MSLPLTLLVSDRLLEAWSLFWPDRDQDQMAQDVRCRVADALQAWQVTPKEVIHSGWVSVVLRCTDPTGKRVILKLAPAHDEMVGEAPFGYAVPEAATPLGARDRGMTLLLPELLPGTPLSEGHPAAVVAQVCGALSHRSAAVDPPASVRDFDRDVLARVDERRRLALPRIADQGALNLGIAALRRLYGQPRVLCHGDLHAGNVLRDGKRWKMIDAKGIVAPQAFDCLPLLDLEEAAGYDDILVSIWSAAARLPERVAWTGMAARACWEMMHVLDPDRIDSSCQLIRLADQRSRLLG